MEDVVLHYKPGSAAGLGSLLQTTEKLLECFPCRTPPVFSPWFPSAAERHPPIRPARPAPVITCSGGTETGGPAAERSLDCGPAETRTAHESPQKPKDDVCVSETPQHLLPASSRAEISRTSPDKLKRSWSVFTQRPGPLQDSRSLSKHFHQLVSVHRLHLRQRVRWVIGRNNCGATQDIEQVWQAVSRSVRSSRLPMCNANIQRERAEIWLFCDVVQAEQVGRFLKDELQLSGTISLSSHRLGNIYSM